MNKRNYLKENRQEIDTYINSKIATNNLNDRERELWLLNDETLYLQAKAKGLNI